MCYMAIVSTTSEADLTTLNTPLVQFSRNVNAIPEAALLRYPNKWFLGSKDGCSCAFRHLDQNATDLGFSEPVDWWEEDQEDIDATLQYAKGKGMNGKWWNVPTGEDRKIPSLYNTYLNPGLPVGPIANPGIEAITAAKNPARTGYYYYIHDPKGTIHFATTLEDHNRNIQKYLN